MSQSARKTQPPCDNTSGRNKKYNGSSAFNEALVVQLLSTVFNRIPESACQQLLHNEHHRPSSSAFLDGTDDASVQRAACEHLLASVRDHDAWAVVDVLRAFTQATSPSTQRRWHQRHTQTHLRKLSPRKSDSSPKSSQGSTPTDDGHSKSRSRSSTKANSKSRVVKYMRSSSAQEASTSENDDWVSHSRYAMNSVKADHPGKRRMPATNDSEEWESLCSVDSTDPSPLSSLHSYTDSRAVKHKEEIVSINSESQPRNHHTPQRHVISNHQPKDESPVSFWVPIMNRGETTLTNPHIVDHVQNQNVEERVHRSTRAASSSSTPHVRCGSSGISSRGRESRDKEGVGEGGGGGGVGVGASGKWRGTKFDRLEHTDVTNNNSNNNNTTTNKNNISNSNNHSDINNNISGSNNATAITKTNHHNGVSNSINTNHHNNSTNNNNHHHNNTTNNNHHNNSTTPSTSEWQRFLRHDPSTINTSRPRKDRTQQAAASLNSVRLSEAERYQDGRTTRTDRGDRTSRTGDGEVQVKDDLLESWTELNSTLYISENSIISDD